MFAFDICNKLEAEGAVIVGPESSVARALSRIASEEKIDAAVLDVRLGEERVAPVADVLDLRKIPFVFATAYDNGVLVNRYAGARNFQKPVNMASLLQALKEMR